MTLALAVAASLAATGCSEERPSRELPPAGDSAGEGAAAAAARLDSARIAALAERYPRLRPDPLPEPAPSDGATPGDPPDRLPEAVLETVSGEATFYARTFEGRTTASGIPFRNNQMVAAHRGYPFGTILRVTNRRNDRSVNVRVVDRGPFGSVARARRTIIDLSERAARELDFVGAGRAPVMVEVLEWGNGVG